MKFLSIFDILRHFRSRIDKGIDLCFKVSSIGINSFFYVLGL